MNIREQQIEDIRDFLGSVAWHGKVLDYGCDIAPYRDIVEAGGASWTGYNRVGFPSGHKREDLGPEEPLRDMHWDIILCTQVLQYVPHPEILLRKFYAHCDTLVLTYATNWPEVEPDDLFRFTGAGMELLLEDWTIERHVQLGHTFLEGSEPMALGYGVVAHYESLPLAA